MAVQNPREGVTGDTQHLRRFGHVQTERVQAVSRGYCVRDAADCSSPCCCLLLVVVDQVDVVGIAIFEAEDHPPVAGNCNAPVPVPTENLVPPLCTLGIIEDLASAC